MRTGTNLVKFALEENFTNVRVLVNIGRWKHAPASRPFNWLGTDWEGDGVDVDVARRIGVEDLAAVRDAVAAPGSGARTAATGAVAASAP